MEMGAARFLRTPMQPFDIVFLDPPFGQDALAEYVPLLDAGKWLKPGGLVYLENERAAGATAAAGALGTAQIEVGGRGGVSSGARQRGWPHA